MIVRASRSSLDFPLGFSSGLFENQTAQCIVALQTTAHPRVYRRLKNHLHSGLLLRRCVGHPPCFVIDDFFASSLPVYTSDIIRDV